MRALITGIAGFAGSHLAEMLLRDTDWEVWGADVCRTARIAPLCPYITLIETDLNDIHDVITKIEDAQPDYIFHLAARAETAQSWDNPAETLINNITIQLNILEACVRLRLTPRILVIGSADEHGLIAPEEMPINENAPLRPNTPYAVSKITQDFLGYQYFLSHDLPIVRVRPFNHIGPRQSPSFVVSAFAKQIADIEAGNQPPEMSVGNLSAERDFTDVRDMVRAYHLAITRGVLGEVYNIGSGNSYTIQYVLDFLLAESHVPITVKQDPARMRPSDIPVKTCDYAKFHQQTGWKPAISIEQSLRDTLNYWREETKT